MNWVLFDEQFNFVQSSSGSELVGADNVFTSHIKSNLPVNKNGYLYIYVSNATPNVDVYFDNLQVTHNRGAILEESHYYPFGLQMAGISNKSAGKLQNKRKWNKGSELQNNEFSDGSGLELYATQFRSLDPQLGRFWQIDPKPNYTQSLYSSMSNNPILYNDPFGDTIRHSFRTGFLGLFGKKVSVTYDANNQRWNNKDGSAYTGKTNNFSNMVLNDLRMNQRNNLGNAIVTNLATDRLEHNIKKEIQVVIELITQISIIMVLIKIIKKYWKEDRLLSHLAM
ncbi:MAG: hypothetical protein IPJ81_07830 [Chitinophagaceae bacterium]|nr:hypothetical protein [Chitinophagaceae bacterium]